MNENFFFIDDSGSRQWETPYSKSFVENPPARDDENINFWRRNYFVLSGIHIRKSKMKELNLLINKEKEKYFGSKYVEIKSDWLRNPHQRNKNYLKPYKITEEKLTSFVENFWYDLFKPDNFSIQSFVLDKRYFAGKRAESTPLALITQMLFDRLVMYSTESCVVVFDQMESDVKSLKNSHGEMIKISNQEINASPFFTTYSHSEVLFEKSSNSNFLQLADTTAYNIYRQFVDYGTEWESSEKKTLPTYEYILRIKDCFHCNEINGQIAGYGIVKYPDPIKKKWG